MKTPRQRLILCLDGTWNNRDDSTNVLHQSILALDGVGPDGVRQRVYYDEGVGNGLLDGVTGGGFGIGLEENVREAYNWLVEHFNDSVGARPEDYVADEIHVFGFSRGAYTARSLVGFIGRCGLLHRGAPLTVNQLWDAYCLIGREREQRRSPWDKIAGEAKPPFREFTALTVDPWQAPDPSRKPDPDNATEQLLVQWSRRARIHYLGLYDTVGAMGLDALAIPSLRGRIALHHNMRPTTLIQKCRHALALDENRRSFAHTPFVAYYGHTPDVGGAPGKAPKSWSEVADMWAGKIEQRWFVGAHSNVGGGYQDNTLALLPFKWIFEGAQEAGMRVKTILPAPAETLPACLPPPRDSFAEFAAPFGVHLFRFKRNYRALAPEPDVRASLSDPDDAGAAKPGFSLQSINESLDPSVARYYRATKRPVPPHVVRFARARETDSDWRGVMDIPQVREWPKGGARGIVWTAFWGAFAAVGLGVAAHFFSGGEAEAPACLLATAAFFFILVDALECRLNHSLALGATEKFRPLRRAALDSLFWTRAAGVVLAIVGVLAALALGWDAGWDAVGLGAAWAAGSALSSACHLALASGTLGVLGSAALLGSWRPRQLVALLAFPLGWLVAPVLACLAWLAALILGHVPSPPPAAIPPAPSHVALAGQLLLLQLGLACFARAFSWVGEPLRQANLPSIVKLQKCATPAAVARLLENWRARLACPWKVDHPITGPAAVRLRSALAESLWRDILGFIPVYALALGYGLWLTSEWCGASWLGAWYLGAPLWCWIIGGAALADWIEDFLQLGYLTLHAQGRKPSFPHTLAASAAILAKWVAFACAFLGSLAAAVAGVCKLAQGPNPDGRGTLALLVALGVVSGLGFVVYSWLRKRWKKSTPAT